MLSFDIILLIDYFKNNSMNSNKNTSNLYENYWEVLSIIIRNLSFKIFVN